MCADSRADANIRTVKAIFEAFVANDCKTAESLVVQNFAFTSPLDNALNRDDYFAICWPNSETMKSVEFCHISKAGHGYSLPTKRIFPAERESEIQKC